MAENIQHDISLKEYNTFHIDATAKSFAFIDSKASLEKLLNAKEAENGVFILGGGSNILITSQLKGIVLKCGIQGIRITDETEEHVFVKAGAGVQWDTLVSYCVERNLGGLENLVSIPGTCGAAPIQNIGAYGVELKDSLVELEAFHIDDRKTRKFTNAECEFGYRESVFKKRYKNEYVILDITLRLDKKPILKTGYGAIQAELDRMKVRQARVSDIARAVRNIRAEKIPDPDTTGNAGSFFKNPVVSSEVFQHLHTAFPDIVSFPAENGHMKLAAGWLIEQCGWKGKREGNVGCHEKQALVIVNHGNATGKEILEYSEKVVQSVESKFSIKLDREVNVI